MRRSHQAPEREKPCGCRASESYGSDGTRTRDLRRDSRKTIFWNMQVASILGVKVPAFMTVLMQSATLSATPTDALLQRYSAAISSRLRAPVEPN